MANPFLMDEDLDEVSADASINPFIASSEDVQFLESESYENPFANPVSNPFAFTEEGEQGDDIDPAMSFFGTTIEAEDDSISVKLSVAEEENSKNSVPPQTQELINTVSHQLAETSSELLARIPDTRSPSPISMRDLHSPSPTPDSGLADLLDVSADSASSANTQENDIFECRGTENAVAVPNSVVSLQGATPMPSPSKALPPRPPPPRPTPPRPYPCSVLKNVPPRHPVPPKPQENSNITDDNDMIDMFGTTKPPKPPPPKTTEDILSLFEKPIDAPTKRDLLSDDIIMSDAVEEKKDDIIFTSLLTRPDDTIQDISCQPQSSENIVSSNLSTSAIVQRAPTPDIEITTVEDLPRSDDEEEEEVKTTEIVTTDISKEEDVNELQRVVQDETEDAGIASTEHAESEEVDTRLHIDIVSPTASIETSVNPFAVCENGEEYNDDVKPFTDATEEVASEIEPTNIFAENLTINTENVNVFAKEPDEFDAFSAKFDSVKRDTISINDGFVGSGVTTPIGDAWGDSSFATPNSTLNAFGDESTHDVFGNENDEFYSLQAPVRTDSVESVEKDFNVVIRPKTEGSKVIAPHIAPPPIIPRAQNDTENQVVANQFQGEDNSAVECMSDNTAMKRTDSQETPQTPLFDEDVSQPLDDFPRLHYVGPGWEMHLRQPNKKKITGQRFWKKIFIRLVIQNDVPVVQLLNTSSDKQPFQELPLQPSYSVSEIGAQQYDQFGKIFTLKLQYIFYKERPGVRPGQVTKAERITNKLTKFAQYAIAGDYEGVKEFGSDLRKLGLPVEHAPQSSQLFKLGSMNYEDMKQFSICIEEALFKLPALRERALTYKMEEVQITTVDEIVVDQDAEGKILKQIARVRLFFLAFLTGMPSVELGLNDMWRQGKEVVGRHDIIPVVTEEWIRLEAVEFHGVVNQEEYEKTRTIKFQPPDANYIELLRFRVRPPKNRELPLQLKATWCVTGNKVELRADILVPGFTSRKLGQIPCEDVSVRFPIPECWIYLFRVEKHFRYGSVKSAHRRTGKIKGIERILGAVDTLQESLIEVTSGQAKYEHHHRAIVWRCPRLPKEGQGAYTTHQMVCRMALTSYDQIPSELAPYAFVEFTMPATQVSHTTVRSVSIQDSDSDDPPEKYVRYLARHEYRVGIETTHGETTNAYLAATKPIREEPVEKPTASPIPPSDSDSDSN